MPAGECLNAFVIALWAIENSSPRVTVESSGSLPDWTSSVGIDVIVVKVEACDLSTRLSSLPSNMGPASMGCLNSRLRAC